MYGPAYTTDHRSPFEMRWGGWFVTGTHRADRHMGNAIATDPSDLAAMVKPETVHTTSLEGRFDMTGYLSPHSDIVALLVLEHQAQFANLVTRANYETRLGEASRIAEAADTLADYMLFVDEAKIPSPIEGSSGFTEKFLAQGKKDSKGRSLREFDLTRRLFKYPCSYLIYSEAFDGLPPTAKGAVYARLWDVLSGKAAAGRGQRTMPAAERQAIIEILRETKRDLPASFR